MKYLLSVSDMETGLILAGLMMLNDLDVLPLVRKLRKQVNRQYKNAPKPRATHLTLGGKGGVVAPE